MRNSRKGEIITALTIGAFVLISAITVITSFFSNTTSKTTTSRASACVDDPGGLPNPNPTTYTWACNVWETHARTQKSCTRREDCPLNNQANNGDNTYQYVDPNSSNICYQGSCLQLQYRGSSQQPTVAPSCNDVVEEVYVRSSGSTAECYVQTGVESGSIGCYVRSNPSEAGRGCNWNETVRANGKFYQKFTCNNINTNMIIAGMNYAACRDDWAKAKFWSTIGAAPTPAASFEHSNLPTAVPTATTAPAAATPTTAIQSPTGTPEVTPRTTPGTPSTCTPACTGATHCVGTTCVPDKQVGCTPACSSKQECVNNQCVTSTVSQNCSDYGANCGTCLTALNVKGKNTGPNCLWSSTLDLGSKVSATSNGSTSGTCIPVSKQCTVPGDKYNYNAKCWSDSSKIQCKYDGGGMNCIGDDKELYFKDSTGQCLYCAAKSTQPAVKKDAAKCNPPTPSATTCSQILSATTSTPACALNGNKYSYCVARSNQPKGLYDTLDQCKSENGITSGGPPNPGAGTPPPANALGIIRINVPIHNWSSFTPEQKEIFQTTQFTSYLKDMSLSKNPRTHIWSNDGVIGLFYTVNRDINQNGADGDVFAFDSNHGIITLVLNNLPRYKDSNPLHYDIEVKFLPFLSADTQAYNIAKFRDVTFYSSGVPIADMSLDTSTAVEKDVNNTDGLFHLEKAVRIYTMNLSRANVFIDRPYISFVLGTNSSRKRPFMYYVKYKDAQGVDQTDMQSQSNLDGHYFSEIQNLDKYVPAATAQLPTPQAKLFFVMQTGDSNINLYFRAFCGGAAWKTSPDPIIIAAGNPPGLFTNYNSGQTVQLCTN